MRDKIAQTVNRPKRFMELEGLRALAAMVVVLFHASLIFYPGFYYGVGTSTAPIQNMRFEDNLYQNPFSGLLSGTFAVGIFFVLSGFVLSIGFFQRKDISILKNLAAKRYLRLMLPALASILFAWLVIKLGARSLMGDTISITHSGWLAGLWLLHPHFFDALYQGIVAIFTIGEVYYNPVLWTIHYEFMGSFIIFGSLLLFASSRYRWVVYFVLLFVFANSWILGFIAGMVAADAYVNHQNVFLKLNNKFTYILVVIGIIIGGYPAGVIVSPIYQILHIPGFSEEQCQSFYTAVGATILMISILSLQRLKSFFSHPKISGLGKYTYSLYLIHMPILFTICTGSFVVLVSKLGFHTASIAATFITVLVLVPVTYYFEKYIDAPSIRFAGYCTDIYFDRRDVMVYSKLLHIRSSLRDRFITKKSDDTHYTETEGE